MKHTIFPILAMAAIACTSCSKDWLGTTPDPAYAQTQESVMSNTDSIRNAINGMSRMMTQQYMKNQWFNGEGTIKTLYGNYPGNDYQRSRFAGAKKLSNMESMEDATALYSTYAWYYYYRIINNANIVINSVDAASGSDSDKLFLKAQALTFRAYCYHMLVQLYSKRWMDSKDGASRGVVLRLGNVNNGILSAEDNNKACSTLLETYQQIYADLDAAIAAYKQSGQKRQDGCNYLPDIDVAYAIYARAAINREDWTTASAMADKAMEGHPLMSVDEYNSGFNTPNKEWIWSVHSQASESVAFFGFFSHEASNSTSNYCRSYAAAISKELYVQIPETDIRKSLFIDLPKGAYTVSTGMLKTAYKQAIKTLYQDKVLTSDSLTYYYYYLMQVKQRTKEQPSVGDFNLFRSSEMYLIKAEAEYHLGNEAAARQALTTLNRDSGRDDLYSCESLSGDKLLYEIRLYNRIELWGEGHDWFNYKRWGLPIVRHGVNDNGSFYSTFVMSVDPDEHNNWCWVIPTNETDYNNLVTAREAD